MKFKELLNELTWAQIEEALIRLYMVDEVNLENYMSVVRKLSTMKPVESKMRLCVDWIQDDEKFSFNDKGFWSVYGKDGSEVTWAIEFTKWNELLGMSIDPETANNIELSKADIVAHLLYELTFCGYEEEEIQDKANELNERVEEVKNMSDEELKKNCCTMDELRERLKKITEENQDERDNEEEEI